MASKELIKIGLHYQGKIYDLQFSRQLTFENLEQLLPDALELQKVELPSKFALKLINKPIKVADQVRLANYAIGNGDQIEVINITE